MSKISQESRKSKDLKFWMAIKKVFKVDAKNPANFSNTQWELMIIRTGSAVDLGNDGGGQ